jgi:hypothetical protein
MRLVEAEDLARGVGSVAKAVPDFALLVFLATEKNVPIAVLVGDERDDGLGLGEARDVVEIAFVPVGDTTNRGCAWIPPPWATGRGRRPCARASCCSTAVRRSR